MADTKISALTAATTPLAGTEEVPIVQGGATVKAPAIALGAARWVTVSLSAEDIASLDSVPITLVEAPGAGKMLVPVSCVLSSDAGVPFDLRGMLSVAVTEPLMIYEDVNGGATVWPLGMPSGQCVFRIANEGLSEGDNQPLILSSIGIAGETGGLGTVSVNAGGTGYQIGDTGEIAGDTGSNATYEVTGVSGGVVTDVTIDAPGRGFGATETALITSVGTGSGDGALTLDVTTLATPTLTAKVHLLYCVADVA